MPNPSLRMHLPRTLVLRITRLHDREADQRAGFLERGRSAAVRPSDQLARLEDLRVDRDGRGWELAFRVPETEEGGG